MAQIHLHAESGDYAPVVLLPGDPNRSKRIAARFDGGLEKAKLVNEHRGLLGYTGTVNGVAGYTFITTVTNGTPDSIGLEIRKPDGSLYFSAPVKNVSGGDIVVTQN